MAGFANQWVEIFRAGDYGPKGNWTPEKLDAVVANFKTGAWKAPAVLGHPETNSPAMGWVEDLAADGGVLKARFGQVQAELERLVETGRFPNRSAAFYLDPLGKGPVLRHVGFLGAMPPEVKGLAPIKFSDGDFVAIDFEEEKVDQEQINKSVDSGIRAFFSRIFGEKKDEARAFTDEDVRNRVEAATKPLLEKIDALSAKFEEGMKHANQQAAASTAANRKIEVSAFVAAQKAANRWVPAFDEAGVPAMLEHLALDGGKVKFGEAGKEREAGCYELMKSFIESMPRIVPTGAVAGMAVKGAASANPHIVAQKAVEYQESQREKGVAVSTAEAVDFILQDAGK